MRGGRGAGQAQDGPDAGRARDSWMQGDPDAGRARGRMKGGLGVVRMQKHAYHQRLRRAKHKIGRTRCLLKQRNRQECVHYTSPHTNSAAPHARTYAHCRAQLRAHPHACSPSCVYLYVCMPAPPPRAAVCLHTTRTDACIDTRTCPRAHANRIARINAHRTPPITRTFSLTSLDKFGYDFFSLPEK